jgi:hypothetical protein
MTHLSAVEFVGAIDGRVTVARRTHLEACPACAERMAALRETMSRVREEDDVPEPSPLFWQHFPARVGAVVREVAPDPHPWWRRPAFAVAGSFVLVLALVFGVREARRPSATNAPAAPAIVDADMTNGDDPAWNLLTDIASSVAREDSEAPPFTVKPAAVDRAVSDLSGPEREELRRLLRDEMKRSGD